MVVGPEGHVYVPLVLDTGSELTTLAPRIATSIGYSPADRISWSVTRTAAAEERGYTVRIAELRTLGLVFRGLEINVADLGYDVEGVIGMNVLEQLNFEVRPVEDRILVDRIG